MGDKPNRFFSKKQEDKVAREVGGKRVPNSGAGHVDKGDVMSDLMLIECKTLTRPQKSHTIQKEWLDKNQTEAFARGRTMSALAFDFGDGERYYILKADDFVTLLGALRREMNPDGGEAGE